VLSTDSTQTFGIGMLLSVSALTVFSGLAVWEVLIAVSTVFAVFGLATGVFNLPILGLLASRLAGLLEHDLLQAVPLYVFFGILLQYSGLANDMLYLLKRMCRHLLLPQELAVILFSGLISPMNGSVAATAGLLKRTLSDKPADYDSANGISMISCAATVGLVIPPSLVLILMGDAMMRAHTEALNSGLSSVSNPHVINTQDMFHAALLPGLVLFILWATVVTWKFKRTSSASMDTCIETSSLFKAWFAIALIVLLLTGVFSGWLYAVEAAASGCLVLALYVAWLMRKNMSVWLDILRHTYAFSGSLLTLLMAATTFSLVFRLYETDQLINTWIVHSPSDTLHIAIIFAGMALCAWMMDAFELIFVIIPIISPGLILLMGDAQQVAVLLLLVIQMSFLLPPMGYAVVIARQSASSVTTGTLLKALLPYLAALSSIFIGLVFNPAWVHLLDSTG